MFDNFPLFPEAASTTAGEVDKLYFFMVGVCGAVGLAIAFLIVFFALYYRRRPGNEIPVEYKEPKILEIGWIVVPFFIFMFMYLWGVKLYFTTARPPDNALEVYATGRQWMWKFQHIGGQSEINELHVPIGRAVKIIAASEDVIHDIFVPAFRMKTDVLPNRYTTTWFQATKTGRFHLYCAEYCGTQHSGMIGWVTVMEPAEYQSWLAGGPTQGSPAAQGEKLFAKFACNTCHNKDSIATGPALRARGPALEELFGKTVSLRGGGVVRADENYLRESMLNPQARVVEGFDPIMPTFQGQLTEADLMQLVAYIKSLTTPPAPAAAQPGRARPRRAEPPSSSNEAKP